MLSWGGVLFGLLPGRIFIEEYVQIKVLNILRRGGHLTLNDFPNEVELLELNKTMTIKIGNWKPPQRPAWVKAYMQTPGPIRVQLLLLTILTISSVSSTVLLILKPVGSTSVVNISGSLELQEAKREK